MIYLVVKSDYCIMQDTSFVDDVIGDIFNVDIDEIVVENLRVDPNYEHTISYYINKDGILRQYKTKYVNCISDS